MAGNKFKPVTEGTRRIRIDGESLSYTLKRSLRARYARLEVRRESGLSVIIPRRYPAAQIPVLLNDKKGWIFKQLNNLQKTAGAVRADTLSYLGKSLKIQLSNEPGALPRIESGRLIVGAYPAEKLKEVLEDWLIGQARRVLPEKASALSARLGLIFNKITVRRARTRWGSCSKSGNLNLNWKLVMAPEAVIEYVLIHELCHLKQMNHSLAFWHLVEGYCPDWRIHRRWLVNHQAELGAVLE